MIHPAIYRQTVQLVFIFIYLMLHTCDVRFDMTGNLEKILVFGGN